MTVGGPRSDERLQDQVTELRHQLAQREARLQVFLEIGRALGSTLSLDQVLALIMDKITHLMDADRSTLFLLDEDNQELWSKVLQGSKVSEIRLKVGEGIAGWVARTGKSINIKDAYRDPRFKRSVDSITGFQTTSCLCQPIRNQERRIIGVVQVLNKRHGYFTVEDENLLSAIANQTAISIENSKLYLSVVAKNIELLEYKERLEQKMYELDILYEIVGQTSEAQDLETLLKSIGYQTLDILDSDACAITLRERRGAPILYSMRRTRRANGTRHLVERTLERLDALNAHLFETGEPFVGGGDLDDPRLRDDAVSASLDIPLRSVIAVPLAVDEQVIGSLQVLNKLGYDEHGDALIFGQEDLKLLTLIASKISSSIASQLRRERREEANRLSAIGQMVSGVLHDLKTPIAIINGYVQLMVRQDDRANREVYAESIVKQFDTLNAMTKEILAFARGDSTILLRKVYLNKLMGEVEEMLRNESSGRNIELEMDVRFRGAARLDEVKVKRVFSNIFRNAIEAMPEGGRVHVTADRDDDMLVFTIADSGSGIPDDIRPRLFERFVSRGKKHGTGLGLAIVKKIIDEHHGTIDFESVKGQGTTFTIRLPLHLSDD